MFSINSSKIEGFVPLWKLMRGWSLLFDTPGMVAPSAQLVNFDDGNPSINFFRNLSRAFDERESLSMTNAFLFCPLPAHSFHVTVLDGVNDHVVHSISNDFRPAFLTYLANVRNELTLPEPFGEMFESSSLLRQTDWNIRFSLGETVIWEHSHALAVKLEPADEVSRTQLSILESEREHLYGKLNALLKADWFRPFSPHVTLGYFANPESALWARSCLPTWADKIEKAVGNETIAFHSISLYGFDRMSCFFKKDMLPFL